MVLAVNPVKFAVVAAVLVPDPVGVELDVEIIYSYPLGVVPLDGGVQLAEPEVVEVVDAVTVGI